MIKVSAPTIELALLEAGKKLGCQCIDLEYEIVEMPSRGFLGFGKKDAVIVASVKADSANPQNLVKNNHARSAHLLKASSGQVLNCGKGVVAEGEGSDFAIRKNPCIQAPAPSLKENARGEKWDSNADLSAQGREENRDSSVASLPQNDNFSVRVAESALDSANNLDSTQNLQSVESSALVFKIQSELNALFSLLPIDLNAIEVSARDKNTISIYFTGKDAALLIGEKGYRYKALSYLLYNWLNTEYGVNMRLEIESFLANQEAMISAYLAPIIEMLKTSNEPFTTKPFDGILAYIALKELRAKLKGKSIILQSNDYDENCIIITPLKPAH